MTVNFQLPALDHEQLAGFQLPAASWEKQILPARLEHYLPCWLDDLCLTGRLAWARLFGAARRAVQTIPIALLPYSQHARWTQMTPQPPDEAMTGATRQVHDALQQHGALFASQIETESQLLESQVQMALGELVALGAVTCDSFSGLRQMLSKTRYRTSVQPTGRWHLLRKSANQAPSADDIAFVAQRQLARNGVIFGAMVHREKLPVAWRDLLCELRRLELAGKVRGARFVTGFSGEQFALPEAVDMMRRARKQNDWQPVSLSAADRLNFTGLLTPEKRVRTTFGQSVAID